MDKKRLFRPEHEAVEVIGFTNIDSQDFTGMWGGKDYLIKAGQTQMFPRYLAEHFAKHLAVKILRNEKKDYSPEGFFLKEKINSIIGKIAVPPANEEANSEKTEDAGEEFVGLKDGEDEEKPAKKDRKKKD